MLRSGDQFEVKDVGAEEAEEGEGGEGGVVKSGDLEAEQRAESWEMVQFENSRGKGRCWDLIKRPLNSEERKWGWFVALLLLGLVLWGTLSKELWDHFENVHSVGVCRFIHHDTVQVPLVWSAGTSLVVLITFSLYAESQMEDIRFHGASTRLARKTAKSILVRELCIVGAMALALWMVEFGVSVAEGEPGEGAAATGVDPVSPVPSPHLPLPPTPPHGTNSTDTTHGESGGGHENSYGTVFLHAFEALLQTLEFFDKMMFLLVFFDMLLVGFCAVCYKAVHRLGLGWGSPNVAGQAPTHIIRPDETLAVLVHFFLVIPFYVKVVAFLGSVVLLADILWPGNDGFAIFVIVLTVLCVLVSMGLKRAGKGHFAVLSGWSKISAEDSLPAPISSLSLVDQLYWARHCHFMRQGIAMVGCMIATLWTTWLLRVCCLGHADVVWVLVFLIACNFAFAALFCMLPTYVIFLYDNPMVKEGISSGALAMKMPAGVQENLGLRHSHTHSLATNLLVSADRSSSSESPLPLAASTSSSSSTSAPAKAAVTDENGLGSVAVVTSKPL